MNRMRAGVRPVLLSAGVVGLAAVSLVGCSRPPAGGAPGGGAAPGPAPTGSCAPVEVVAARGTGEPQTGSFIMGGLTNGIARQVAGSVYHVRYPAGVDYMNGPNQGAADALAHLQAQGAKCPGQKFVLNGYSEGAMVMVTLMQRLPAELGNRVVAVVLYGNPYYKSSSPAAAGSAKGMANGIMPIGGVPAAYAAKTRDFCAAGDPVCGAGANVMAHVSYGTYQADGIAFAVGQVRGG
jgi:pimeloyl-ACP methyl ester carboxylesterase